MSLGHIAEVFRHLVNVPRTFRECRSRSCKCLPMRCECLGTRCKCGVHLRGVRLEVLQSPRNIGRCPVQLCFGERSAGYPVLLSARMWNIRATVALASLACLFVTRSPALEVHETLRAEYFSARAVLAAKYGREVRELVGRRRYGGTRCRARCCR